jgi:HAD superfamily hydrolase (TIGR01509 family)
MDGVIVDSNPFHKIAINQFCERHGLHLDDKELRTKVYGRTNKEWLTQLFGNIPEEQLKAYADEKEEIYRRLYRDDIRAVDGLVAFLEALDRYGIPRAIGTSAPKENVDFTLDKTGTRKFFPVILDQTVVTHGKPSPEIYLKVAKALGLPATDCIVIEDSLSGVDAGKGAGSKVIGITTTHPEVELSHTDLVISNFDHLNPKSVIEKFFGSF